MAATMGSSGVQRALEMIRNLPRVALNNIKDNPGARTKHKLRGRGQHGGNSSGRGKRGQVMRGTLPRIGFEGGQMPFYLRIPKYPYYKSHHLKREYLPVSLSKLQYLIDVGRINPDEPVDVTTFVNAGELNVDIYKKQYGIHLTEEGADTFKAQVNIEVQWATELTLAAIERRGGVIHLGFYDLQSLDALAHPLAFFNRGKPIPKRALPPKDAVPFYTDSSNRGYLADPDKIRLAKAALAEKFGYILPDLTTDPKREMLKMMKDPRQVFFGLQPGWIVNLTDKTILKPTDEQLIKYFRS
ncbi:39S ribosomal protein L15, mitochondrial-like [Asterias rubens]|uniref:39S ribosomal protein L15, mitochondrial-like n=1 Tax=Asterias rubens TaxID=7604 RepID=UPI001454FF8F|nr:39S ribosomal protein L15, mitochondrial-like [Asterias rubens]